MSIDGRTDGRTITDYLSVRLSVPHTQINDVKQWLLHDVDEWCIYKHGGGDSDVREHLHICIPGLGDKYRKRCRDRLGGGNKNFSVKQFHNGYSGFVFYCAHEASEPIYEGEIWKDIIVNQMKSGVFKKRGLVQSAIVDDRRDKDWQLMHCNFVRQAVYYAKRNMPNERSLKLVVKDMLKRTKWAISASLRKSFLSDGSIAEYYQSDFEFRLGLKEDPDLSFWPIHVP